MGNCNKPSSQNIESPRKKVVDIPVQKGLNLIMRCWKQTHNNLFNFKLFDAQVKIQTINNLLKKVRLVKLGEEYQALLAGDQQFSKIIPPIMIDINELKEKDKNGEKKYLFQFSDFPKISKPFWIVVKSLPKQRYLLKQGDIFKMGKIKLRVKEIVYKNSQTRDLNKDIQEAYYTTYDCEANNCEGIPHNKDFKCRICMQEGEKSNPLIGLCDCSGTSKYTHLNCLKQWFTTQINATKINLVTQVNWKVLECEFCKAKLPYSINIDNGTYYLVNFPKIKKPYLVLNPVYKANNQKSKIYYFVSFKKRNRMIVGRKNDNDIQLCSDATLSRSHSVIEYVEKDENEDGQFYLYDNKSKFGTVVLLNTKNPLVIEAKMNGVQFQVSGDTITIMYKTKQANLIKEEIDFNVDRTNIQQLQQFNQDEDQNDVQMALGSENDKSIEKESQIFEHQTSNNKMFIVK